MTYKILVPNYYWRVLCIQENLDTGKRALNIGCSDGYYDSIIAKNFEDVYGIEINVNDLLIAKNKQKKKNVHYIIADGCNLPFKDKFFDEIICVEVLEHIKNDLQMISEISRVIKPNGNVLITVPNEKYPFSYDPINWFLRPFKKHLSIGLWGFGHERLYTEKKITKLLLDNNIKPTKVMYISHFLLGLCEFDFCYVIEFLQRFTKSDPQNRNKSNKLLIKSLLTKNPPGFLTKIRDSFICMDKFFSKNSRTSLGIFIKAKKIS